MIAVCPSVIITHRAADNMRHLGASSRNSTADSRSTVDSNKVLHGTQWSSPRSREFCGERAAAEQTKDGDHVFMIGAHRVVPIRRRSCRKVANEVESETRGQPLTVDLVVDLSD